MLSDEKPISFAGYRMQPRPTAILQSWYSLVREKRVSRQDFLKAMLKVFDVDATLKASQVLFNSHLFDFTQFIQGGRRIRKIYG